jgi:hypothetical protein
MTKERVSYANFRAGHRCAGMPVVSQVVIAILPSWPSRSCDCPGPGNCLLSTRVLCPGLYCITIRSCCVGCAPTTLLLSSMTSSPRREIDDDDRLDEQYVQDAFHSFLKSSLAQARVERLLDVSILSSAEGDLMITGVFIQGSSCARTFKYHDSRLTDCHQAPHYASILRPCAPPLIRLRSLFPAATPVAGKGPNIPFDMTRTRTISRSPTVP